MTEFKPIRIVADSELPYEYIIFGTAFVYYFLGLFDFMDKVKVEVMEKRIDLEPLFVPSEHKNKMVHQDPLVGLIEGIVLDEKHIYFILSARLFTRDVINMKKVSRGFARRNRYGVASFSTRVGIYSTKLAALSILHELGHVYGLCLMEDENHKEISTSSRHCEFINCVMYENTNSLSLINFKKPFCKKCERRLKEKIKKMKA